MSDRFCPSSITLMRTSRGNTRIVGFASYASAGPLRQSISAARTQFVFKYAARQDRGRHRVLAHAHHPGVESSAVTLPDEVPGNICFDFKTAPQHRSFSPARSPPRRDKASLASRRLRSRSDQSHRKLRSEARQLRRWCPPRLRLWPRASL